MIRILHAVRRAEGLPFARLGPRRVDAVLVQTQHLDVPDIAAPDLPFRLVQQEPDVRFHGRVGPLDDFILSVLHGPRRKLGLPRPDGPLRHLAATVRIGLIRLGRPGAAAQQKGRRKEQSETF